MAAGLAAERPLGDDRNRPVRERPPPPAHTGGGTSATDATPYRSDHGKWSHRNMTRHTVGRMSEQLPPQKPCPDCAGRGTVDWETPTGDRVTTQCSGCGGTGTVLA